MTLTGECRWSRRSRKVRTDMDEDFSDRIQGFEPDYAASPWHTVLESVGFWIAEDRPITQDIADALAAVFAGESLASDGAAFWVRLEADYRATQARIEARK